MSTDPTRRAIARAFALLFVGGLISAPASGQTAVWTVSEDLERAWKGRDFALVERIAKRDLAAIPGQTGDRAVVPLVYLSGAETVAGRRADAAGHFTRAVQAIIKAAYNEGSPPFLRVRVALAVLMQNLPAQARPALRAVLHDSVAALDGQPPPGDPTTTKSVRAVIAAGVASLCLADNDVPAAAAHADEALRLAPPADRLATGYIIEDNLWDDISRFTIRLQWLHYNHSPRATALIAALSVEMKRRDAGRLRPIVFALEDLWNRALFSGSLKDDPFLSEELDKTYKMARREFSSLWTAVGSSAPVSPDALEGDPRLGKAGRASVKRGSNKYRREYRYTKSLSHYKVTLPASLPAAATAAGKPPGGIWWLYHMEDGQLRIIGRAHIEGYPDRPRDPYVLRVSRLAIGKLWWVGDFLRKAWAEEAAKAVDALGPIYVSLELLGPDFAALPGHLIDMFKDSHPWVGMTERLMRAGIHQCREGMEHWEYRWDLFYPPSAQTGEPLNCLIGKIILRNGVVTEPDPPPAR
ncbi:MAG: hypothetical protein FJY79_05165 [Candidatus Aminicenantes bacterium]|nr:hypothetical protein [Candidatus Aminicenantes bacterium]